MRVQYCILYNIEYLFILAPTLPPAIEEIFIDAGIDIGGLIDSSAIVASIQDSRAFALSNVSLSQKISMGHQLEETVPLCFYDKKKCLERQVYDLASKTCKLNLTVTDKLKFTWTEGSSA